ncbi:microtubule-associated tumor suppressor candidate 2 isoform X2 [Amia ocellicauda]|uniref:microtubule-associated tumor suppressor candidate 2 isoform X2 n=1 Tax=Amia ocellicauda TaxID=2972642 RepID=UPI00346440DD
MSVQGEISGPYGTCLQDNRGEIKNNNKQAFVPEGDTNANEILAEDGYTEDGGKMCEGRSVESGTIPPLVSQSDEQDKIIIWGTGSQCDDPDLEEFELLECQELEAYLVEEGKDSFLDEPSAYLQSSACTPCVQMKDEEFSAQVGYQDQESNLSLGSSSKAPGQSTTEFSSENDIFVSCVSVLSSPGGSLASTLDSAGRTQAMEPQHTPPEPFRMTSEDTLAFQSNATTSVKGRRPKQVVSHCVGSTAQSESMDLNLNSTSQSQEALLQSEAQPDNGGQQIRPCEYPSHPQSNGSELTSEYFQREEGDQNRSGEGHQVRRGMSQIGKHDFGEPTGSLYQQEPRPLSSEIVRVQSTEQTFLEVQLQHTCIAENRTSQIAENIAHKPSPKPNGKLSQLSEPASEEPAEVNSHCLSSKEDGADSDKSSSLQKRDSSECVFINNGNVPTEEPLVAGKKPQLGKKYCAEPSPESPTWARSTGSPRRRHPPSPAKVNTRGQPTSKDPVSLSSERLHPSGHSVDNLQQFISGLKAPSKVCINSGIPKPILQHSRASLLNRGEVESSKPEEKSEAKLPPKPKHVRPKIITYIRKSPQVKPHLDAPYDVSTLPSRLSTYTSPLAKEPKPPGSDPKSSPVLSASNILYDKYRHEMQKARFYSSGLVVSGIKPPSHTVPHKMTGKSDSFYGELSDKYLKEIGSETGRVAVGLAGAGRDDPTVTHLSSHEAVPASVFRSSMVLRPQLGLGAVSRLPSTKSRMLLASQRSALTFSHQAHMANAASHCCLDPSVVEQRKSTPGTPTKSGLPKPVQSGLRPPGYSRLPAARLAAFGFVRSASVSSVSSNQSNESSHTDPCRSSTRPSSGGEEPANQKVAVPPSEAVRGPSRGSPQPTNTPVTTRRTLLPTPRSSPVASRKEIQKDVEVTRPAVSSPKKFAVAASKPQSPVHTRQKPGAPRSVISPKLEPRAREAERQMVQRLKEKCEEQARQLQSLQEELKKATLGLEVFAITTQHFCQKSESALVKERELSLELANLRDEVAFNTARWERLQRDKEELERRFERELRRLHVQQEAELTALEDGLRAHHRAERDRLQAQHQALLENLCSQQQEQIEEINVSHEATVLEMENSHTETIAELQDEHEKRVKELKMAHELERKSLEEDFEKLRLSLQDQVDTLTFQNRSLRDRAKRFEEALRRSTDEQIEDALAPYQHIEEDLKSLKHVLEMKNLQIHEQENKILELEKLAEKNVVLEERVQVLQQQNEDLKARIDRNLAMSRQLSEENANLQEHVEKESNEKKRLSRTNEELLWRLQTGELLSPRMSPSSSPVHRSSPGPASPSRLNPFPR